MVGATVYWPHLPSPSFSPFHLIEEHEQRHWRKLTLLIFSRPFYSVKAQQQSQKQTSILDFWVMYSLT